MFSKQLNSQSVIILFVAIAINNVELLVNVILYIMKLSINIITMICSSTLYGVIVKLNVRFVHGKLVCKLSTILSEMHYG